MKGSASMGKKGKKKLHVRCRRCGHISFHVKKKVCSHCGFGKSSRTRNYSWKKKGK